MNYTSGGETFKFEIIDPIGHGQFSTVYKARWLNAPLEPEAADCRLDTNHIQHQLQVSAHHNINNHANDHCTPPVAAYGHPIYTGTNSVDLIDPRRQLDTGFAAAQQPTSSAMTTLPLIGSDMVTNSHNSAGCGSFIGQPMNRVRTCEKLVALKRVKFYEIPNSKERMDYLKEVNLLQKLKHPNIINYNISFTGGNELFIVLELADGGDLSKLIKYFLKKKRLILEQTILKYFTQVCSAVEYIHSKRILHRDIKPANIFMTSSGCVKLGDFGLGRFFSQNTRDAHSIVGTFYYMSPERIRESGYGFSSDVWSLGCVLYELITLNSPFSILNYEQNYMNFNCADKCHDDPTRKKPLMQHQQKARPHQDHCYNNKCQMTHYDQHQHCCEQQPMQQQQSYNLQWLIDRIVRAEYPSLDGYNNISPLLKDLVYKCLNPHPDSRPNMQYMCSVVYQCFSPNLIQQQQTPTPSPRSSTYEVFANEL